MAVNEDENSYLEYKKYLEDSIGFGHISKPPKPMNPYQFFVFERICQQRSQGKQNFPQINRNMPTEWKQLPPSKKQYYQKIYQILKRQREDLLYQFTLLSKQSKKPTAYSCYFKKRYKSLAQENQKFNSQLITRIVAADWKNLTKEKKKIFIDEAEHEKNRSEKTSQEKRQLIAIYEDKVRAYKKIIEEHKEKIMEKFGVSARKKMKRTQRLLSNVKGTDDVKNTEKKQKTKSKKGSGKNKNEDIKQKKQEKRQEEEKPSKIQKQKEAINEKKSVNEKTSNEKKVVNKKKGKQQQIQSKIIKVNNKVQSKTANEKNTKVDEVKKGKKEVKPEKSNIQRGKKTKVIKKQVSTSRNRPTTRRSVEVQNVKHRRK